MPLADIDALAQRLASYAHVIPKRTWGETSFFVNPGGRLTNGAYFATLKEADGPNDMASDLGREGVWRLSFGPPPKVFEARFGPRPARPAKGEAVQGPWDFTALDTPTPHPVYAWMGWIAVLCPSPDTLAALEPDLAAAHAKALAAAEKRLRC